MHFCAGLQLSRQSGAGGTPATPSISDYNTASGVTPDFVFDGAEQRAFVSSAPAANDWSGLIDSNFVRASSAIYFDSAGAAQTAASGVPRNGHHIFDGAEWVNRGLLMEPSRTNSFPRSTDLTASGWNGFVSLARARNEVGVRGGANEATTLTDPSGSGISALGRVVTIPNDSKPNVVSLFIKKDTNQSRFPEFRWIASGGSTPLTLAAQINTQTGATAYRAHPAGSSIAVEKYGDWWRVILVVTNNSTGNTTGDFLIYPAHGLTLGGTDNSATGSVIVDLPQAELEESYPSMPIPSEGSTVTRAADDLEIPNTAYPFTADAAGSAIIEFLLEDIPTETLVIWELGSASNLNRLTLRLEAGNVRAQLRRGSLTQVNTALGPPVVGVNKVALAWNTNDFAGYLNDNSIRTDSTLDTPTSAFNKMYIGGGFNNHLLRIVVARVRHFDAVRLPNAVLEAEAS
ncbi:MAG: hypothetical protein AAF762_00210 [Pseudomonadota bacterium]